MSHNFAESEMAHKYFIKDTQIYSRHQLVKFLAKLQKEKLQTQILGPKGGRIIPGPNAKLEKDAINGCDFNSRGLQIVTGILKRGPLQGATESMPTTSAQ